VEMPGTALITGTGMAGAHISDPSLGRVVLFSSASDGSPPAGSIIYTYQPTGQTMNVLFDLLPGARYTLGSTLSSGQRSVTLTPEGSGAQVVNNQGVLTFMDSNIIYVDPSGVCDNNIPCYDSIQKGVDSADTYAAIKAAQGTYAESFVLDSAKLVELQGGWDPTYTSISGRSTVRTMKISNGKVTINQGCIRIE